MSFGSFVALLRFVLLAIATFSGSRSNAAAASFLDSENIGSGGFQAIVQEGTFRYDGSVNIHAASAASRGGGVLLAEGEDFVDSSIFPARIDEPHATRGGQKLLGPARNFAEGQLEKHFGKHAAEWGAGNITKDAYLKRAGDLLGREPGGNILGAARANGDILRYNIRTNEFAVGTAEGTIRTLFRPTEGLKYWLRQVP